jgi:hypothetical protein
MIMAASTHLRHIVSPCAADLHIDVDLRIATVLERVVLDALVNGNTLQQTGKHQRPSEQRVEKNIEVKSKHTGSYA